MFKSNYKKETEDINQWSSICEILQNLDVQKQYSFNDLVAKITQFPNEYQTEFQNACQKHTNPDNTINITKIIADYEEVLLYCVALRG